MNVCLLLAISPFVLGEMTDDWMRWFDDRWRGNVAVGTMSAFMPQSHVSCAVVSYCCTAVLRFILHDGLLISLRHEQSRPKTPGATTFVTSYHEDESFGRAWEPSDNATLFSDALRSHVFLEGYNLYNIRERVWKHEQESLKIETATKRQKWESPAFALNREVSEGTRQEAARKQKGTSNSSYHFSALNQKGTATYLVPDMQHSSRYDTAARCYAWVRQRSRGCRAWCLMPCVVTRNKNTRQD